MSESNPYGLCPTAVRLMDSELFDAGRPQHQADNGYKAIGRHAVECRECYAAMAKGLGRNWVMRFQTGGDLDWTNYLP